MRAILLGIELMSTIFRFDQGVGGGHNYGLDGLQ